jgi:hypothetical protein
MAQNSPITPKEAAAEGLFTCMVVSRAGIFHASLNGPDRRPSRDLLRAPQGARSAPRGGRFLNTGKTKQVWLKRSLGTKVLSDAKIRVKPVQMEFDKIIAQAEAQLKVRPLRTTLSAIEIKLLAEYYYANKLAMHDEYLRVAPEEELALRKLTPSEPWSAPVPAFGLSQGQMADGNATIPAVLHEAEVALAQGNIAHIAVQIDQVLDTFQINLDQSSAAYRALGLTLLRAEVKAIRAIQR